MAKIAFNECKFDRSILSGGKGEGAQFTACSFKNCNFRAFDAGQAVFTNCSFDLGSVDDSPAAFEEMVVQGTNFVPRQEETIQALLARGAVENRSRYMGPFGESFMQRQGEWLGAGLEAPEEAYVKQIEDFLKLNVAREHVTMVELMAGGSNARLLRLLVGEGTGAPNAAAQGAYENVRVLAIDRDTRFLRRLREELGSRLRIGRWTINGRFGLAEKLRTSFKDDPTSEADIIIGKKALHELPCDAQAELIAECAEVLRPGGILTIFADAPDALSVEGRQRLNDLIAPLRTGEISDAQFRECYLNSLTFGDTPDDAAVFSILWIAVKDWANKNWNELHRRYYSTAEEIVTWATTAGLEPTLVSEPYPYWVSARRFNEIGFNKIGRYLEQHSGKIATADHPLLKDWIAGGPHHALFFQFNDHHLWDSTRDRSTALGAKLLARRGQVDFRGLHPALGELVLGPEYDQALGFALRAKVFTFQKNGRSD